MTSPKRVLVVEDEVSFVEALSSGLRREGFALDVARDGREALERFEACHPDVILLDVMLPRLSGLDVCRQIRNTSEVPIIMVSAKGEEIDTVVGLEVGADDYVPKPYRLRELVARIRAVMRRYELKGGERRKAEGGLRGAHEDVLEVGEVCMDTLAHEVKIRGENVRLPRKEFELLRVLLAGAGRVILRDELFDEVWGKDYVGDSKTLDAHIRRLRQKVELDPSSPCCIVTIRGAGYKYALPESAGRQGQVSEQG